MGAEEFLQEITILMTDNAEVMQELQGSTAALTASMDAAVARLSVLCIILCGICLFSVVWKRR